MKWKSSHDAGGCDWRLNSAQRSTKFSLGIGFSKPKYNVWYCIRQVSKIWSRLVKCWLYGHLALFSNFRTVALVRVGMRAKIDPTFLEITLTSTAYLIYINRHPDQIIFRSMYMRMRNTLEILYRLVEKIQIAKQQKQMTARVCVAYTDSSHVIIAPPPKMPQAPTAVPVLRYVPACVGMQVSSILALKLI